MGGATTPVNLIKLDVSSLGVELLSPLTHVSEVDPLIDAGATSLYAGVDPSEWRKEYAAYATCSRRPMGFCHFPSFDELGAAIDKAHARKVPVHLILNLTYYTARQAERIDRIMDSAAALGVDGFIIADPPTMVRARREHPDIKLSVSTLAPSFNVSTLEFYASLGADRVTLPRQLTVDEITAIARDAPVDLAVFVFNGREMNVDGLCTFEHGVDGVLHGGIGWKCHELINSHLALTMARCVPRSLIRKVRKLPGFHAPPCLLDYHVDILPLGPLGLDGIAAARERMASHFVGKTEVDCGACIIRTLSKAGVKAVKIAGRALSSQRKVQDIGFISSLLRAAEDTSVPDTVLYQRTRDGFQQNYHGTCSQRTCYYHEFLPS